MQIVLVLLAIFVVLLMLRVPVAVSMGLASLIGFLMIGYNLTTVGSTLYTAVASTSMITIPGYILAGSIMANGGISKYLLEALRAWIGHIPGGIAIATVLACALFAAITGSSSATIAAVGGLMIPAMVESNYRHSFSMGLVASAGSLGILIPPSIPMILYTTIASVSVSKLFAAGMLPGFIVVIFYSVFIVIYSIIYKQKAGTVDKTDRLKKTIRAIPALLLPVAILGFHLLRDYDCDRSFCLRLCVRAASFYLRVSRVLVEEVFRSRHGCGKIDRHHHVDRNRLLHVLHVPDRYPCPPSNLGTGLCFPSQSPGPRNDLQPDSSVPGLLHGRRFDYVDCRSPDGTYRQWSGI